MTMGTMEVTLLSAKGLKHGDFIGGNEPYVLIQYKNQEHKSSTLVGQGNNPVWNEKFHFKVNFPDDDGKHLVLKIMDYDRFSADDYLGETTIYLKELLDIGVEEGKSELRPQKYRVVSSNKTYQGEIQVGVNFQLIEDEADYQENNWSKKNVK